VFLNILRAFWRALKGWKKGGEPGASPGGRVTVRFPEYYLNLSFGRETTTTIEECLSDLMKGGSITF